MKLKIAIIGYLVFLAYNVCAFEPEHIAREVIRAIQCADNGIFLNLLPNIDVMRSIGGNELKNLSDDQVISKLHNNPKLKGDFENLAQSISNSKIDPKNIKYISHEISSPHGDSHPMRAIEITYDYLGETGIIAVSSIFHKDEYYFHEILISYNIFDGLKR